MTDSSLVYTTNFVVGANGPQNFITKLKAIFDPLETTRLHHWKLDDSLDGNAINNGQPLYALLKAKEQTWATDQAPANWGLENPNDQQILIEVTTGTNQIVYVTYFPKGGVTVDNYATDFVAGTTPVLNSGRCQVMKTEEYDLNYSPSGNWFSGQFWIAEHRDINVLHSFSSLTLMFNTGQYQSAGGGNNGQSWGTGFHVGRIVSPINWNDPYDVNLNALGIDTYHSSPGAPLITGDGVIVGVPDMWIYSSNYWFTSNADAKSVIRVGDIWQTPDWDYKEVYSLQPPEAILSDANSWQRLIPLECRLAFNTKCIGYTKYIRFYKSTFNITPTVIPTKYISDQAWVGWKNHLFDYTSTGAFGGSRLCLLWNKNYTIVP